MDVREVVKGIPALCRKLDQVTPRSFPVMKICGWPLGTYGGLLLVSQLWSPSIWEGELVSSSFSFLDNNDKHLITCQSVFRGRALPQFLS